MKEYIEDENIQEEDDFSTDVNASETADEGTSEFDSDFTEGGSDYAGLDQNYGLGDENFESDFSGLDHNYGLGDDNFETNLWEQEDSDDSSDDGYWEPPKDTTDDWGDDDSSTSDDWEGGEGDGGGWGTDGDDCTNPSSDFDAGDTSDDSTE